ncbi:MAG: peptide chain release factor 2 [Eubacteriales bacterium]|jgi:peptide chain release factor 2|nr:peptide chain release factor 2 [Clostridiales bacterium]
MLIALEEAKYKLNGMRSKIAELVSALSIDKLRSEAAELDKLMASENFWADQAESSRVIKQSKRIKEIIEAYESLERRLEDAIIMCEMAIEENDESIVDEITKEANEIEAEAEQMRIDTLLSGEYDESNAIVSFHPGAGGTEAQDWALMLYRMYTRWGERHNYKVKLVDWLDGEEAGLKSATIIVEGKNAYGYLKSERGVHRLVRISPFDASGRRHTSFASVEVLPELPEDNSIVINENDLEITTHKSSGAGGQHINKTESAVRILHKPTGIIVSCQNERSQLQNKETALKMLKARLMEIKEREHLEKIEDIQGVKANIEWGSQIRSYVFMPYTLVKDTRTGYEDGNIQAVMDGDIDGFINAFLVWKASNEKEKDKINKK